VIPFLLLLLSFPAQAGFLSRSWAGASHEPMELIRKNDSVLAAATKADRDSNGGYSHVSQGP
jgi:hypothetical protein